MQKRHLRKTMLIALMAGMYAAGPVWAQDDHHPEAATTPAAPTSSDAGTPGGTPMMGMGGPGQGGAPMMGMGGPGQGGMPMMGMGGPGQGGAPMMGMGGPGQGGAPMMGMGGPGQGGMPMMGMGDPGQGGMPMMGMGGPGQGGMPMMAGDDGQQCKRMMQGMHGDGGHHGGMAHDRQAMGQGASRQEMALIDARLAKIEALLERLLQQR